MKPAELQSHHIDAAAVALAEHAAEIKRLGKRAINDVIEIGKRLTACKEICGHGGWLPWLDREFKWTEMTATRFINIYTMSKSNKLLDLNLPISGLYLLAAPGAPQEARDAIIGRAQAGDTLTVADVNRAITTAKARKPTDPTAPTIMLKTYLGEDVPYPMPKGKPTFNSTNEQVSWAAWTWNPVTGCLHNCRYCYARDLANKPSYRDAYPVGFTPLFHHERLDGPKNTKVPDGADLDPRLKRVFVCSMADLYGKWVPTEWIEQVHANCIANPQWEYLFLTKFPQRYVGMKLPPTAWIGTTVDEQYRVKIAEEAFRKISGVRVKWLSLEPLLEPLEFTDLSMFDWVVIGSQSATQQPEPVGYVPEFAPPIEWVLRIIAQAREAGCRIYLKPNLLGIPNPQSPGMELIQESPAFADAEPATPGADDGRISDILRAAP